MTDRKTITLTRRIILGMLLGGLVILSWLVLQLFLIPVAWAGILAYTTWPIYLRLRKGLRGRDTISALVMTVLLTAAFVLPLLWLIALLRGEAGTAYAAIARFLENGPHQLPDAIAHLPFVGEWLQQQLDQLGTNPQSLREQIGNWVEQRTDDVLNLVGGVGRNAAKLGFALLTVFFLYRNGENLLRQVHFVLHRFLGARVDGYISAVGDTTKAVVYGLVLTALAQGLLAGLGYWVAGVQAPALLAALTVLIALIPFGTPFVWGSIGIWLIVNGNVAGGVGLLLWGALVVSWIDNIIRPLVISNATRIPFLLVMFGVLGGLAAFGLVGLFLGPVILAVFIAVWHEWLEETQPRPAAPADGAHAGPLLAESLTTDSLPVDSPPAASRPGPTSQT